MENQIWRHTLAQHPELVNAVAPWQETPIQVAAHVGNRTIAEYLLAAGVRLDICTAAMLGQVDMVRWLLDHGSELRGRKL